MRTRSASDSRGARRGDDAGALRPRRRHHPRRHPAHDVENDSDDGEPRSLEGRRVPGRGGRDRRLRLQARRGSPVLRPPHAPGRVDPAHERRDAGRRRPDLDVRAHVDLSERQGQLAPAFERLRVQPPGDAAERRDELRHHRRDRPQDRQHHRPARARGPDPAVVARRLLPGRQRRRGMGLGRDDEREDLRERRHRPRRHRDRGHLRRGPDHRLDVDAERRKASTTSTRTPRSERRSSSRSTSRASSRRSSTSSGPRRRAAST